VAPQFLSCRIAVNQLYGNFIFASIFKQPFAGGGDNTLNIRAAGETLKDIV
jgi:hypothetical protein